MAIAAHSEPRQTVPSAWIQISVHLAAPEGVLRMRGAGLGSGRGAAAMGGMGGHGQPDPPAREPCHEDADRVHWQKIAKCFAFQYVLNPRRQGQRLRRMLQCAGEPFRLSCDRRIHSVKNQTTLFTHSRNSTLEKHLVNE